jgi:GalNAc-alpha-(1->4)-GalNAc-alpha-(1->3)-diNAcBac-PP-undecaprenol alpha-1,4-N-acetyl-D-galactosaminyltransferase
MSLLASELARRGHEVTLVTFSGPGEDFFRVNPSVRRISIGLEGASSGVLSAAARNVKRAIALRKVFDEHQPDVVLSFLTSMNVLAAAASTGLRHGLVVSERVDPSQHSTGRVWDWLRMRAYGRAAVLVVQTDSAARWFRRVFREPAPQVVVIPNPLAPDASHDGSTGPGVRAAYVLGVGRLEDQKGFDVLIDAFARLGSSAVGCELWIAGQGSRRASLEQRALDRGVGDRVRFLGEVGHAAGLMQGAAVFALPSRFEGFPNALLEAMASGAPCVAADCPSGPRELLGDDEGGLLVPVDDVDRLAEAINRILADRELASRLSVAGRRIAQTFSLDAVAERWERVFSEAVCRR